MSARGRTTAVLLFLILLSSFVGCSSSSDSPATEPYEGSGLANGDLANTRFNRSAVDAGTIADLERVWSIPLRDTSEGIRFIASPVVKGGVAYVQDARSNVSAIDLKTGDLLWEQRYEEPVSGPNGVIVAGGRVCGGTSAAAFGLDAKTGREVWSTRLSRGEGEQVAMAPGFHGGRVYISTTTAGNSGEVGVLWALEARSGHKLWHFNTVPPGLWGHPEVNYGGGADFSPAFDGRGSMYVEVSNAGPIPGTAEFPWGSSRPGRNLYTNSIVKLDEMTGEVEWYHQIVPHGVCTGGIAAPVLATHRGREIVIAAGMFGIVVALDQRSGELLWRRSVGIHNGHDDDGLTAMRGELAKLKLPAVIFPGLYGGVFGPMATHGPVAFIPVVNGPVRVRSQTSLEAVGSYTGELVALNLSSGAVEWRQKLPVPVFGPVTATNDLVLITSWDGVVHGFSAATGKEVWKEKLSKSAEGGMAVAGDTLLFRAGFPSFGDPPKILAYRLPE